MFSDAPYSPLPLPSVHFRLTPSFTLPLWEQNLKGQCLCPREDPPAGLAGTTTANYFCLFSLPVAHRIQAAPNSGESNLFSSLVSQSLTKAPHLVSTELPKTKTSTQACRLDGQGPQFQPYLLLYTICGPLPQPTLTHQPQESPANLSLPATLALEWTLISPLDLRLVKIGRLPETKSSAPPVYRRPHQLIGFYRCTFVAGVMTVITNF